MHVVPSSTCTIYYPFIGPFFQLLCCPKALTENFLKHLLHFTSQLKTADNLFFFMIKKIKKIITLACIIELVFYFTWTIGRRRRKKRPTKTSIICFFVLNHVKTWRLSRLLCIFKFLQIGMLQKIVIKQRRNIFISNSFADCIMSVSLVHSIRPDNAQILVYNFWL